MANLFPLHPEQEARIMEYLQGPKNGEDDNAFDRRMNATITENDRQWIVDFMEQHRKNVESGLSEPIEGRSHAP